MARPKRNVNASVQRIEQIDRAAGTEPAGEAQAEAVVSRPKRPLVIATRNRLTVPGLDHKNFHYHWQFRLVQNSLHTACLQIEG